MQLPRKKSGEVESTRGSTSSLGSGSDSTGGVSTRSGPGATSVSGGTTVFRVTVPDNVRPGEEFQGYAGSRIVRVRCPPDSRPGQSLQVTVPAEDVANPRSDPNLQPDSPNVRRINDPNARGGHAAYMITINTASHLPCWSSISDPLKRHPFSGLVHSAGELLHTP